MNTGWLFLFALCIGLPVITTLGFSLQAWLRYRYQRATLDALKSYAASGRDPPEALVKALTEAARNPYQEQGSWAPPPPYPPYEDVALDKDSRRAWRDERRRWRHRYRKSAVHAWQQTFFWIALTGGFWFASEQVHGDAHNSLVIVSIITGAVAAATILSAVLTTIVRLNERASAD